MKKLLPAATLVVFCVSAVVTGLPARNGNKPIIIEGTILNMSPTFGQGMPSGIFPHYRLVKYRVDRVCKGKYDGDEMVVDHFIVTGDELKDRKVGDKVYALVWKSKKGGTIHTYKGIRDSTEGIKYVYRGGDIITATSPSCSFDEKKLLHIN